MTPEKQQFYERLAPAAMEQQIKYGIPASVTLAQAWIEHGNYSKDTNNYFGIHDDDGWWRRNGGQTVILNDHGRMAHFRVYSSMEQGIEDHSKFFFRQNSRYSAAHGVSSTAEKFAEKWAYTICRAGYAERPKDNPDRYAKSIMGEINSYDLTRFDRQANALAAQRGTAVGYMRGQGSAAMQPSAGSGYAQSGSSQGSSVAVFNGYCFPVAGLNLVMSDGYGIAPTGYRDHPHNGIDLRAKYQDVFATENLGKVVDTGYQKSGGNYVVVEYDRADGAKWRVSYCHLKDINVRKGDTVDAGKVLGVSGNSGNSTGPHLHLTVKRQEAGSSEFKTVDPLRYLAEVSVRGNLQGTVLKKDTNNDLLASLKAGVDTRPTPADELLLAQRSGSPQLQGSQYQQGAVTMQQPLSADALVQQFGQANDPLQMLSYMMQQQNIQGSSEGFLSGMISTLFKGAMLLALQLQNGNGQEPVDQAEQMADTRTPEQQKLDAVLRRRETPDVEKARQMASMSFDAESPEQQQNAGVRLA